MFSTSRGSMETLFRWSGKYLHAVITKLIRKICVKLYQNRSRFVKDMTETFFRFAVSTAVHLQNANANFHKVA